MRKVVASCLFAFLCGCAAGENGITGPDDAGVSDDVAALPDAPHGQDAPSTNDSSVGMDSNIVVGSGPDAEPDGNPGDDGGTDSAPPDDATTTDTGTSPGGPDSSAIDSSSDVVVTLAPATAPTAPTEPASKVISLYSAAYTGGTANGDYSGKVDTYDATCFGPNGTSVTDYTIAGTAPAAVALEYVLPASTFGIIELIGVTGGTGAAPVCNGGTQTGANEINATAMTHVHVDVWSPQGTSNFQIHLVGADTTKTIVGPGGASGATAGTDYASPAIPVAAGAWVSIDLPLSEFGPAGAPGLLTQLALVKLFTVSAGTFFVDNVYLYE